MDIVKRPIVWARSLHLFGLPLYQLGYLCALFFWIVLATIGNSSVHLLFPHHGMRMVLTLFLFIGYIIFAWKPNKKSLVFDIVLGLVILNCFRLGLTTAGMSLTFVLCARPVNFKDIAKVALIATCASMVALILLSIIGIIPDFVYGGRSDSGLSSLPRHSLGFGYTTFASHYYLLVVLLIAYLKRANFHWWQLLLLCAGDVAIYLTTFSRNSFALVLLVLFVLVIHKIFNSIGISFNKKIINTIMSFSFIICAALSFVVFLAIPLDSPAGQKINSASTGRLLLTQNAFRDYGTSLFGRSVEWATYYVVDDSGTIECGYYDKEHNFINADYNYVDSSYCQLALTMGIVPFVVMLALLTYMNWWFNKRNKSLLLFIFLIFAIHSIMDPQLLELEYCTFIVMMAYPWNSVEPIEYLGRSGSSRPYVPKHLASSCG